MLARVKPLAGLIALSFLAQLGLQNFYIACTYADHTARHSTVIAGGLMLALLFSSLIALLAAKLGHGNTLSRVGGGALLFGGVALLGILHAIATQYRFASAVVLAVIAGAFLGIMLVVWTIGMHYGQIRQTLLVCFGSNTIALLILLIFFSWCGQVVWFDFPSLGHQVALYALIIFACLVVYFLRPKNLPASAAPEDARRRPAKGGTAADWRSFIRFEGARLSYVFAFCFLAAVHWEVNAMSNGNRFDVRWSLFGHQVQATGMATCFIVLSLIVLAAGVALILTMKSRLHTRTLLTVLFYLVGCSFFVPGLLGFSAVSSAGFMMVGMFLFFVCGQMLCGRDVSILGLPPVGTGVIIPTAVAGMGAGLLISWAIAPLVYLNDVFLVALTSVSLFLVMIAPSLLVKASTPSLDTDTEQKDQIAIRCREISLDAGLTPREAEVMELASRGYSAPAISATLLISENTVRVHMRHIYDKLGIHNKQELIKLTNQTQ